MNNYIESVFDEKKNCCGCGACFCICQMGAIKMMEDDEGFVYPRIIHEKCVGCRQCERVCPINYNKN